MRTLKHLLLISLILPSFVLGQDWLRQANFAYEHQDWTQAKRAFDTYENRISRNDISPESWALKGDIYRHLAMEKNDSDRIPPINDVLVAVQSYRKVALTGSPVDSVYHNIFDSNAQLNQFYEYFLRVGKDAFEQDVPEVALQQFQVATLIIPHDPSAYLLGAETALFLNNEKMAMQIVRNGLRENPRHQELVDVQIAIISRQANDCIEEEQFDQAMYHLLHLIQLQPDNALFHLNLGWVYEKKDQWDLALNEYEIATLISPQMYEGHYNLGLLSYKKIKLDEENHELDPVNRLRILKNARHHLEICSFVNPDWESLQEILEEINGWLGDK